MKGCWKINSVLLTATALLFFANQTFAQYGACAPACETSVQACAPSCESYPTCDATCDVGCYADCYGDYGCCNPCDCFSIPALFNGVCSVVTAPFRWICCGFTDGVFPDCGCAPRPPKSNCNPCDICGNYQGGCNDNCDYSCGGTYGGSCGSYESCSPCGSNAIPQPANQGSYNDSYSVGAYDAYAQNAPIFNGAKNFGVQKSVNPNLPVRSEVALPLQATQTSPQRSPLRSVSYEQKVGAFRQAATQGLNRQAVPMQNAPQVARARQNNANVQAPQGVVERPTQENANVRSFGMSRPVR